MKNVFGLLAAIVALAIAVLPGKVLAEGSMEYSNTPVVLEAKDVLPADALRGENFSVESQVRNDGLINIYRLTTDYGPLEVESTAELLERIQELHAMNAMEAMDKKKVFGESVIKGVKAPFQGAVNLVKDPVDTSKGIVEGAGKFFSNIGRSIVSDDPYQDNVLKVAVGYDASKRAYAYEFGINPYSAYEPAMAMLGEISQAAVAGGIAPRAAMAAIGGDITHVMSAAGTAEGMRKLVRDNPPGELHKINTEKLAKMGVSESLADAFLSNAVYDPQEETILVGSLELMENVGGKDKFVAAATLASDRSTAILYRTTAQLMAGYHSRVSALENIDRSVGTPYARTKDGKVAVLLPLDFIFRTPEVQAKLNRIDGALGKAGAVAAKELWITGKVHESAREMLEASGWRFEEETGKKLLGQ